MEMTFGSLLQDLRNLSLPDLAEQVLQDNAHIILQRNKAQMYRGENSVGGLLPGYRNLEYAVEKHRMNALPGFGNADHYLTGAYYDGWRIDVDNGEIHQYSVDSKATKLEKRVGGESIQHGADLSYGLGEKEHNDFVRDDLMPSFMEAVHRELSLAQ